MKVVTWKKKVGNEGVSWLRVIMCCHCSYSAKAITMSTEQDMIIHEEEETMSVKKIFSQELNEVDPTRKTTSAGNLNFACYKSMLC